MYDKSTTYGSSEGFSQHATSKCVRNLLHTKRTMITPVKCYKDDDESQWKSLKFDPRHAKTPEPMATKIGRGDYVPDIYPVQNCITIRLGNFAPNICEVAYQMFTRLVFWSLPTRYP